jgi:hypothetical protein
MRRQAIVVSAPTGGGQNWLTTNALPDKSRADAQADIATRGSFGFCAKSTDIEHRVPSGGLKRGAVYAISLALAP